MALGPDVLAQTAIIFNKTTGVLVDAVTVVNSVKQFSVYDGPLQAVPDLGRVVLHELGHVLGLDHPDTCGQQVSAIMNSQVSNTFALTPDDIAGAMAVYGPAPLPVTAELEAPAEGDTVSGIGVPHGWAFGPVGNEVVGVTLFVDGAPAAHVPCCTERADVAQAFANEPNALNSGFGILFNYNLLPPGFHEIAVQVTSARGDVVMLSHGVTAVRLGGAEFLSRFDLSAATASIVGNDIILQNVLVTDKASGQSLTISPQFRWSSSAQGLVTKGD